MKINKDGVWTEDIYFSGGNSNGRFEIKVMVDFPCSYPPKEVQWKYLWVDEKTNEIFSSDIAKKVIGYYK